MDKIRIRKLISSLAKRDYRRMYMNDFFPVSYTHLSFFVPMWKTWVALAMW